jgi:glutathione-regulated potassium-efflux system ancillary protein KefG
MPAPRRVLILFAHPALERSRVQRPLAEAVRDLKGVTFRDLYELYPDFDVDVGEEQALLVESDVVVFQHPVYWYSAPALVKEWLDLVLEHGWAYGHEGTALHGKTWVQVVSTGGGEETYRETGVHGQSLRAFLAPFEATARLCGMHYLAPFSVYATHGLDPADVAKRAADYRRLIEALRDDRLDLAAAEREPELCAALDRLIRAPGGRT